MASHQTWLTAGSVALALVAPLTLRAAPRADVAVRVAFSATVGSAPFSCTASFHGIGQTGSTIAVSDFRFYVSNVRVGDRDGHESSVTLTQDALWQNGSVSLLDFEDGTGSCSNGTAEVHQSIEGTAPAGHYTMLRFDLGLPFDVNHRDPTSQPSPLNLSQLFWNWNGGYKFFRLDLASTRAPQGWVMHLGSTGCLPRRSPNTVPTSCAHENRPTITLTGLDLAQGMPSIGIDLAALLSDSNVDSGEGCMSAPDDVACGPLFHALGLPFGAETTAPEQRVFHVAARR
jgi:uncharacterized repeat protein (TIGR04052 family)